MRDDGPVRVRQVGASALLVEVDDPRAWFAELWRRREAGEAVASEIVPGARTVLLDGVPDPAALAARLPGWAPRAGAAADSGGLVEVPVTYGGPDLADVADLWGTCERGVIERLTRTEFRVAFCGFAPGFAYLAGLPPELAVPRLPAPRPAVPAGSVGLAGGYAGIYPTASPGGWRLVGRTTVRLFDVDRDPPALLPPGTRVRLVEAPS
jgi:KipI family sensor histidine kinase inhibitor